MEAQDSPWLAFCAQNPVFSSGTSMYECICRCSGMGFEGYLNETENELVLHIS